jgi:putative ribosome biogenesis GTPase RsgA
MSMSMREEEPALTPFRISLLGPSGVGKTSLVTAMLAESQKILAGSGTAMRPVGPRTSDAIARNQF